MTTYWRIWWTVSTLLALLGAAAAIVLWSVPIALLIFGCAAVVTASITAAMGLAEDTPMPWRELMTVVTTKTLLAGIATVALFGFGAVVGVAVLLLVLIVAASSPPAVVLYLRYLGSSSRRGPGTEPVGNSVEVGPPASTDRRTASPRPTLAPPEPGPGNLDDAELCRAWRRSYWALRDATSAADRIRIVEARQGYLDELERRHPGGLAGWFESGARPGGDPSRFLANDDGGSHRPE